MPLPLRRFRHAITRCCYAATYTAFMMLPLILRLRYAEEPLLLHCHCHYFIIVFSFRLLSPWLYATIIDAFIDYCIIYATLSMPRLAIAVITPAITPLMPQCSGRCATLYYAAASLRHYAAMPAIID